MRIAVIEKNELDNAEAMEATPFGLPSEVIERHAEWDWSVARRWLPDANTWRLRSPANEVHFLKVAKTGWEPSLLGEGERLQWAARYVLVPGVIECRSDGSLEWLLTEGLPGRDATNPEWTTEPRRLVPLLAQALRQFHESIPVEGCPFDFRAETALQNAARRVKAGLVKPQEDFHSEHRHFNLNDALRELHRLRPASEELVVCHGDYCLPNVLVDNWRAVGYLDLGELGVADRWWDVAVGAWSVTWNLGEGWEDLFYESYGVRPDLERIAFYRLLYDLSS